MNSSTSSIQLVVFDMAGTTLKDEHEVEHCFALAAQQTNLNVSEEEILAAQGWSKRYVFETFWEKQLGGRSEAWEREVDNSYEVFRTILEDYYRSNPVQPTEGCLEAFEWLRSQGIAIALTTGFYRKVANIILEKLGWLEGLDARHKGSADTLIQLSITSDEVPLGRPAPDMIFRAMELLEVSSARQVVKVGDTPSDLKAGKAAGCARTYGVVNGTHSREQLAPYPNDGLLSSLKAFREMELRARV